MTQLMAWLVMGIWRAKGWTSCKSYISRRRKHGSYSERESYDRKRTIQRQIQSNVADRATSGGWKSTDDFHLRKISWNFRLWYTWEEIAGYDPHSNNLYIEGLKDLSESVCTQPNSLRTYPIFQCGWTRYGLPDSTPADDPSWPPLQSSAGMPQDWCRRKARTLVSFQLCTTTEKV